MAHSCYLLLIFLFVTPTLQSVRHGFPPELLHMNNEDEMVQIGRIVSNGNELNQFIRAKRNAQPAAAAAAAAANATTADDAIGASKSSSSVKSSDQKNIETMMNRLNDTHAQLMVHWLGEGTNVMLCLGRDPPPGTTDEQKSIEPSSVYISYDNGDTFDDKTSLFRINVTTNNVTTSKPSYIDQFSTHTTYNTIIFTDARNKVIVTNSDSAKTFQQHNVNFTPSEISFYEYDARTFLVLDKVDPERKLYYTTDFGQSFSLLQSHVKSFTWSSSNDANVPVHLYVERKEPTNSSTVIFMNASTLIKNEPKKFNSLIENVQDFHVKKDFMFATRKVLNATQLFISYKRGRFIRAEFQTELNILGIHIADVEGKRIMLSAAHSHTVSHLYVSELDQSMNSIKFVLSLEKIFTYIPELTWTASWLVQMTDDAFTDLYKVEGLHGIYIASKVAFPSYVSKTYSTIGPEHLVSMITFDHGMTWQQITAPTVDDDGQIINCTKCALHLSQRFCQLYPVTRSVNIMSSKTAPGVIMATGNIGKNMKGLPCVFISRDAGQTWKMILKNYHFFNYGDHGGLLVAVRYFKSKGETREILYSTDEGETWLSYKFHSEQLKLYGLMTEPNSNSTEFTLFGSERDYHSWLILKIDLKNAFDHNCTTDDYKYWSPGSIFGDSRVPCILGVQETYQRRAAHSKCFNGKSYDRPVRTEICQCSTYDFECDFGFSRLNANSPCIRNKTASTVDIYKVPSWCRPGLFFNRTKGYRLIDGDQCIDGNKDRFLPQSTPCPIGEINDFLIVAQRDKISRISIPNGEKQVLPVTGLKNVIAIEFDMKHNCVFWADIQTDQIGRQCLNGNKSVEILLETELASVEGMSYDWISELLYFVDGTRFKIEALSTSMESIRGRMRRTIIDSKNLTKPRGIVVHPIAGYLFWTDWSFSNPSISRANTDGSDIKVLFTKPQVVWPNGVTIDFIAERVYWVDASRDYIGSCDLNGRAFVKIIEQDSRVSHPFAVAVYKDLMYWDDWKLNSVFSADKDHGIMILPVAENMTTLMDLKIYAHSIQSGTNECGKPNNCSHICVGSQKSYKCLCPDSMIMSSNGECLCPGSLPLQGNKTCPQIANTCAPGFFSCNNKLCIPSLYKCDQEDDCGDNSDEIGCHSSTNPCLKHMFQCKSDLKCIPDYFVCDHDRDCVDGSDEASCPVSDCKPEEFKCDNGRCINKIWQCDGEDDCHDRSDEKGCVSLNTTHAACKDDEFKCNGTDQCIVNAWVCDHDPDCADSSDEVNCETKECDPWMFACGDGKCIYKTWKCDGDKDCSNGHDEENCPLAPETPTIADISPTCHDWMFRCNNHRCVPYWWKCDGINDCGDSSDELGCPNVTQTSTTTEPPTITSVNLCLTTQFQCDSGQCLAKSFVCDGYSDCKNGEDEKNCPTDTCGRNKFRCRSDGICLDRSKYCDGIINCVDASDEEDCKKDIIKPDDAPIKCQAGYFVCDNTCAPLSKLCNGKQDCYDFDDETNCADDSNRHFQISHLYLHKRTVNATSFLIFWYEPTVYTGSKDDETNKFVFEYLPSISSLENPKLWKNESWIDNTEFRFGNLKPYYTYNVTIYVRTKGSNRIDPPISFMNVTTAEGVPTEPQNVNVAQLNGTRVQVSWDAPKEIYGILKEYTVYYRAQTYNVQQAHSVKVSPQETSIVLEANFEPNITYEYWVRARNTKNESPNSKLVRLTFDKASDMDRLSGLHVTHMGKDFIQVAWTPIKNIDGYLIQINLLPPYPKIKPFKTNDTKYKIEHIPQGVDFNIKVCGFVKNYVGRTASISSHLPGKPLPEIKAKESKNGSNIVLTWDQVALDAGPAVFGIYYGRTYDEMIEEPKLNTTKTQIELINLLPCESYLIGVGIIGPDGPGPLPQTAIIVETPYDESKPPRNLQANMNANTHELEIMWEHNCPLYGQYPASYIITLHELTKNQTSSAEVKRRATKVLKHTFIKIPRGAIFNISVASNTSHAQPSNVKVNAPPLPLVHQLKVYPEKNGTYVVFWHEIEDDSGPYEYELVVVPGLTLNQSVTPIIRLTAKEPPMFVNPEDLGGVSSAGLVYTMGVRLKSPEGYYSQFHEIEHIEIQPDAWLSQVLPTKTSMWLVLIPLLMVVGLTGTVFYMMQRHRRLSNSFSRFANPHYDTKTGSTRIGDAIDDDDHHGSTENIHDLPRFDDDEPLVLT